MSGRSLFTTLLLTMQKGTAFIDAGHVNRVSKRVEAWRKNGYKDRKYVCRKINGGGTLVSRTK